MPTRRSSWLARPHFKPWSKPATREIQRVKEAMTRQAEREAASMKKKLEAVEEKAKDVAADP
jgi:hypothetical protein